MVIKLDYRRKVAHQKVFLQSLLCLPHALQSSLIPIFLLCCSKGTVHSCIPMPKAFVPLPRPWATGPHHHLVLRLAQELSSA